MTNFATKISAVAMLALAALPIAALPASAFAANVKVSDIDVLTPAGVATFERRADNAARNFCREERTATADCRQAVKAELTEKLTALRTAKLEQATQTFAAR